MDMVVGVNGYGWIPGMTRGPSQAFCFPGNSTIRTPDVEYLAISWRSHIGPGHMYIIVGVDGYGWII